MRTLSILSSATFLTMKSTHQLCPLTHTAIIPRSQQTAMLAGAAILAAVVFFMKWIEGH